MLVLQGYFLRSPFSRVLLHFLSWWLRRSFFSGSKEYGLLLHLSLHLSSLLGHGRFLRPFATIGLFLRPVSAHTTYGLGITLAQAVGLKKRPTYKKHGIR